MPLPRLRLSKSRPKAIQGGWAGSPQAGGLLLYQASDFLSQ